MTEATLVDVEKRTEERLKNKEDRRNDTFHQYETYYEYELTWEFMNIYSEKKYRYTNETESMTNNAYSIGDKETIFIYYSGDESDYEFADPFGSIIFLAIGTVFIVPAVLDIIGKRSRQKKARASEQEYRKSLQQKGIKQRSKNKPHPVGSTPVLIIKSGSRTIQAIPEDGLQARMFVNLLSKGEISTAIDVEDPAEKTCALPWHISVPVTTTNAKPGDILLCKGDRMSFVCTDMTVQAVRIAAFDHDTFQSFMELAEKNKKITMLIEWSE